MRRILKYASLIIIASIFSVSNYGMNRSELDDIVRQIKVQVLNKYKIYDGRLPEYTKDGVWQYRDNVNWFSGFIGGELWNLYEITDDEQLKAKAIEVADFLIDYSDIDYTHDMGFIFFPSCVKAYKHTGDVKYKNASLRAARMLAKRYNQSGHFIRSWGKLGTSNQEGVVIIDTMMNLELLFWAAAEYELPELYEIAYKHAVISMNEHVRQDYSTYHAVEFDPASGKVIKKYTHQGLADETTWARGQAWAIYGFANAYKYTRDERFLRLSQKLADYFLNNIPADLVPTWDLSLVNTDALKDASAAAIAASGLYLLAEQSDLMVDYNKYSSYGNKIIEELLNHYLFTSSSRKIEEGILIHTIYHFHKKWGVDESYPCGDYYLTEALNKYYKNHCKYDLNDEEKTQKVLINDNWFYLEEALDDVNSLHLATKKWKLISLPHTWNAYDIIDQEPGYRRSISWYRKDLNLNEINPGKNYFLEFEGVNLKATVFVNGKLAGEHIGGYVGFNVDITALIKQGHNEIVIKADNSIDKNLIPSQKSDFFIMGGITRDVYLKTTPKTYVGEILISTPVVNDKYAKASADIKVHSNVERSISINCIIEAPSGKIVSSLDKTVKIQTGENLIKLNPDNIDLPDLWSTQNPNLYTLRIKLSEGKSIIHSTSEKFGCRWFEFKEHGAFYLNGKKLLLRGTHRHEDFAGYGNAMPNELHRKDMQMIKDMGANFVRLGHYPQDPEIYKACDELGLLVWDELPWCRGGVGESVWKENALRLFREQIIQNYNHPSIILWSVGNEIYWLPDFQKGGETDSLRSFVKVLHDIARQLDPYRLTSIRKFYEGSDIVDVFSPSIWAGWYSGVYKSYRNAIDDAIAKYTRFFHAEYGGSSHMGRHTENTITGDGVLNPDEWSEAVNQVQVSNIAQIGDWSENYIVDLFDWHLSVSEKSENFTGNAQWAFKDFGTPLRPENPLPYMNQKGLVDRAGNPKDAYYVFKSYWTDTPKFVYIESHTWKERSGKEGQTKEVNVFSNCENVEMIINGKSYGSKKKSINVYPSCGLTWEVDFTEGRNTIVALGDQKVRDTLEIEYFNSQNKKPEEIVLSSEKMKNGNYLVTAKVVDEDGRLCPDYNQRVYFSLNGPGKLIENYGTYTGSSVIEFANGSASIEFKPVPFEESIIEARNQDFKGAYISIKY